MSLAGGSRKGFALITVLWLVVVLGAISLTLVRPLLLVSRASTNRAQLTKARWAARSCVALMQSRAALPDAWSDSVALGATTWCDLHSLRPDERINPNHTDSVGLSRVLHDPVRVASLLDWIDSDDTPRTAGAEEGWYRERGRPTPRNAGMRDPLELALVRGFEDADPERLEATVTLRGDGSVSPNRAPRWALESISALPAGLVYSLMRQRGSERLLASPEQVVAVLGVEPTIPEYQEMVRRLSFRDQSDVVRATGYVHVGRAVLTMSLIVTVQIDRGRMDVLLVEAE